MKIFVLRIFTLKKHVPLKCERLIRNLGWGGDASSFSIACLFFKINIYKNLLQIIFLCCVFLVQHWFGSHCLYYRVKNVCSGRSSNMQPNFDQQDFFEKRNFYNHISPFSIMLIINWHSLSSLKNRKRYICLTLFFRKLSWVEKVVEIRTFMVMIEFRKNTMVPPSSLKPI